MRGPMPLLKHFAASPACTTQFPLRDGAHGYTLSIGES